MKHLLSRQSITWAWVGTNCCQIFLRQTRVNQLVFRGNWPTDVADCAGDTSSTNANTNICVSTVQGCRQSIGDVWPEAEDKGNLSWPWIRVATTNWCQCIRLRFEVAQSLSPSSSSPSSGHLDPWMSFVSQVRSWGGANGATRGGKISAGPQLKMLWVLDLRSGSCFGIVLSS